MGVDFDHKLDQSFEAKLGQSFEAKVVEVLAAHILVVDINGKLFRVTNRTGQLWRKDDTISVRVSALNPIEFQIHKSKPGFERFA